MRLLDTKTLQVHSFGSDPPAEYAILSHRWKEEEVTLQDIQNGVAQTMRGYEKLKKSCETAGKAGYDWIWIDTCCIDKTSSAELSEAINSMFQYYEQAIVCYAYLADVKKLDSLEGSEWFTRGWTLQELLAPRLVKFFDVCWNEIGTKQSLSSRISSITGIPEEVVLGKPAQSCNIAQRMSWAAGRETTRKEDIAYCLLGIFDIHMSPIYGEGAETAFLRLQEEILRQSGDHTLFIWTPKHDEFNQGLLATSPAAFCKHSECFAWMEGVPHPEDGSFDPYAQLVRVSSNISKQVYRVDETTGRTGFTAVEDSRHTTPAFLGQLGLQIFLLSHISDESQNSRMLGSQHKILTFDVLIYGADFRSPVHLALTRDITPNFIDGRTSNRLGMWRRHPSSENGSSYFSDSLELSFERSPFNISQVKTPRIYSGPCPTFAFYGKQGEDLVSHVVIEEPRGCLRSISKPQGPFSCFGGVVDFQHSCNQCDSQWKVQLHFGGHGTFYKPWCFVGMQPPQAEDKLSIKSSYDRHRLISCRFSAKSTTYMRCKTLIGAKIEFRADKDCYFIVLSSVVKNTYSVGEYVQSNSSQLLI